MPIELSCQCGRTLRAADRQAGRRCKCPACGRLIDVPIPVPVMPLQLDEEATSARRGAEEDASGVAPTLTYAGGDVPARAESLVHGTAAPLPVIAPPPPDLGALEKTWRGNLYWLLLLPLIPLAIFSFEPHLSLEERIQLTSERHPELGWGGLDVDGMTPQRLNELIDQLPTRRLEGAVFARTAVWHWLFALGGAGVFMTLTHVAIPTSGITAKRLFFTGLFTGTLGVIALLLIQFFGMFCCIGLFYVAAFDPRAPFGPSLLGFVLGIGACEEIIKCLPVLWLVFRGAGRVGGIDWRFACAIGMASGAGFGISEGILYSVQHYNGIESIEIYFVRFLSAVALHALLSGACAIMIWRKQEHLLEDMDPLNWVLTLMAIILLPIFLHGLYNALAKQEILIGSLAVAVASFVWLWWLIRTSRRREQIDVPAAEAALPRIVRTPKGTMYVKPGA